MDKIDIRFYRLYLNKEALNNERHKKCIVR